MKPQSRFVTGGEGIEIHVLEWSEEGVPFLLLHGFGNEAHIWDDFAPAIAPHYRTLAIDLRGHGDSGRDPEAHYDYPYHVADLEAVTKALGISRFVLMGHSLGGRIATLFAGSHTERMAGMVLVDSGPEFDARGVTRIQTDMQRQGDASFASILEYERLLSHAYPAAQPKALTRMAHHGLRQREDGRWERKTDPLFHTASAQMNDDERARRETTMSQSLWDALGRISCPTLVVRGAASDILSPETADRMVEDVLPDAHLAIIPQAGHSVMTDNPEDFCDAVCGFALS